MKFELTYCDIRTLARGYEAASDMYQRMASRRLAAGDEAQAADDEATSNQFAELARRWDRTWELAVGIDPPIPALADDEPCTELAA